MAMDASRLALALVLIMVLSVLLVGRVLLSADSGNSNSSAAGAYLLTNGSTGLGGLVESAGWLKLLQQRQSPHVDSDPNLLAQLHARHGTGHGHGNGTVTIRHQSSAPVHREADLRREHDQDKALQMLHHGDWRSPQPGSDGIGLGGLSADNAATHETAAAGSVEASLDSTVLVDAAVARAAVAAQASITRKLDAARGSHGNSKGTDANGVAAITSMLELQHTHEQLQLQGQAAAVAASAGSVPPRLHCTNQSACIVPELQLAVDLKIYFCAHVVSRGVRFYYLVREGLLLHPRVRLVHHPAAADYLVYLPASGPWHKTECNRTEYAHRLLVLDEFDLRMIFVPPEETKRAAIASQTAAATATAKVGAGGSTLRNSNTNNNSSSNSTAKLDAGAGTLRKGASQQATAGSAARHTRALAAAAPTPVLPADYWYFAYFKRSFVARTDGLFQRYAHASMARSIFPLVYSIAEAYIPPLATLPHARSIDIVCTLRGHKRMQTRLRVQQAVQAYVLSRNVSAAVTGQVDKKSRTVVSTSYFQQMRSARIVVTVNPMDWEGDFRLMESLATGALIFVDRLYVPHPHPLLNHVHVVQYDNRNLTELAALLDYYRNDPVGRLEGESIAMRGYQYALKFHRTVSMLDYILRTVHRKAVDAATADKSKGRDKGALPAVAVTEAEVKAARAYTYTGQFLNAKAATLTSGQHGGFIGRYGTPGTHLYLPGR